MTDREKELLKENEKLKKENRFLTEIVEKFRIMEVELSTQIDFLREGIIK